MIEMFQGRYIPGLVYMLICACELTLPGGTPYIPHDLQLTIVAHVSWVGSVCTEQILHNL